MLSPLASVLRLASVVACLIVIVSFVLFVSTQKRQALHDMIASTTVIHDPHKVVVV